MRKNLFGISAALLFSGLASQAMSQTSLKFSYELPVTHPFHAGSEKLRDCVAQKTNNMVKIELYPAGQIAKDSTFIKSITSGTLDGGLSPTLYWTGVMPIAGIFDVPFVITSHEEANKILNGPIGERLLKELDSKDLVGLGFFNYGFGIFGNNKKQLKTPSDFAGLKIRTNNDIGAKLLVAYGASPVFMSGSEVFIALERGTVDGSHLGLSSIVERKIYQTVKNLTVDNHNAIPYFVVFSKEAFRKLKDDQKVALKACVTEVANWVSKEQEKGDSEAIGFLRKQGMDVIELTPEQIKVWQAAAKPAKDYWLERAGPDGQKILTEMEAALKK